MSGERTVEGIRGLGEAAKRGSTFEMGGKRGHSRQRMKKGMEEPKLRMSSGDSNLTHQRGTSDKLGSHWRGYVKSVPNFIVPTDVQLRSDLVEVVLEGSFCSGCGSGGIKRTGA